MNFLAWHNVLFLSSLGIGILIAISAAVGAADLDADAELDVDDGGGGGHPEGRHGILSALDLGQIPFTVLLLVSSLIFGITGIAGSLTTARLLGVDSQWTGILLVAIAFVTMIFLTGRIAKLIIKHVPASETHVASAVDLIDHEAIMVTSRFADVRIGADMHRVECRTDIALSEGAKVHLTAYDPVNKIYDAVPLD